MARYAFEHLESIGEALRRSPFGLVTDVDGTISPTAPTPQQAEVTPLCRRYLELLCQQIALVAAVSGRSAAQVAEMVDIGGMVYIGNHGLERWVNGRPELTREARGYQAMMAAALSELKPLLSMEGIIIENKGVTATIHYRRSPDPASAEKQIAETLQNSSQASKLHAMPGRMAINLLPPVATNKGTATSDLIREYGLRSGVYLGDDVTDIDAFKAIHDYPQETGFHGLAIGVISEEMPEMFTGEVDFTLNGVRDVERFLEWLSRTASQPG
ncbi:MAG: trehalose-phosphatase [Chloroflexi bacterium]|nr:trehalose-phosphatase [Chloroflexota bacterium]